MLALAFHLTSIERYRVFNALVRNLPFHVVQQFMLYEKHRVGVTYCRFEHALGIVGSGGHDNFEARDMRVPGLQHLRVLCSSLRASTGWHSHNKRYLGLSAKHVMEFGRAVDNLIARKQAKIDGHEFKNRAQTTEGSAYRGSRNDFFSQGGIAHTLFAKLLKKSFRNCVGAPISRDIFA